MIKAYGYNLSPEEITLIQRMISVIGTGNIFDLKSFQIESDEQTILLLYGKRAHNQARDVPAKRKVLFPTVSNLLPGHEKEREEANKILLEIVETLVDSPASIPIVETLHEGLPDISFSDVKELERQQIEKGINTWKCTRKDGKKISVSIHPFIDPTADFNITFAELFAATALMEIFNIKEISLVKTNINTS